MITIFYARFAYINPGMPIFLKALQDNPPRGMRAVNVSELTPDAVTRIARESSTVAIDQSIENAATWAKPDEFSVYRIRGHHPLSFFAEISERLWDCDARRVFISNFDLHDLRLPALIEKMRGRVNAISWMFEKRPLTRDEVPTQYLDSWLTPQHDPLRTWNLIREIAPVRIEMPFSISPAEFAGPPGHALWDACIPGVSYATRTIATAAIRKAGLSCAPAHFIGRAQFGLTTVLGKVAPAEAGSLAAIRMYHVVQRNMVRASGVIFVCGSGVSFATRKFFEIPALQLPMIAYPCVGFDDYGFADGTNVLATLPEDAGEKASWLHDRPIEAKRIAAAGQKLIERLHSVETRVGQFAECLRRVDSGSLRGAEFRGGRFEIQ